MDFRSKLGRLPSPDGAPAELDELRDKMAELLGRAPPAPRPAADPAATLLPFARRETPRGPLYERLLRLAPSHHVGRMPSDAAAAARPEMLALLALEPGLAARDATRALYLDTETTGLGGSAGTLAFLVGMAWFADDGRLVLEQLLLRSPAEEAALIERVAERLEQSELVVSYNGKAFDLPLLRARAVMNRLPALPERPHLDLLHVARRLHKARLGACRLVDLEREVLGFERGDDIAGADVAPRFAHFLRTGDEQALAAVVEHNAWDVVSMAALVGLYGEPMELLGAADLVGLARTLRRAGAPGRALAAAEAAVERGAGPEALRVRGELEKARGERGRALADFEALAALVDDPAARLELAKLYEHHVKEPLRALDWVRKGTGEAAPALERRRGRLERKLARPKR
ncbi:MAG: ribonuclease H-like domain-containing protein [Polyangiaceae bacterium]|nr:ribonuclease H-like domain-containing protein [Polyangiaceae bacterium]